MKLINSVEHIPSIGHRDEKKHINICFSKIELKLPAFLIKRQQEHKESGNIAVMGIKSREGKGHHEIKRKIVDSSRIVVCIDPGEKCAIEEDLQESKPEIIGRKDQKDSIDHG